MRSNFASAPVSADRPQAQILELQASDAGAFCSTNITWNSGVWARLRSGAQLLHQLLERQVLVGVGAERRLAHPAEQLAEGRIAREVARAAPGC